MNRASQYHILGLLALIVLFLACEMPNEKDRVRQEDKESNSKLTIAAAANMQFAMDSIVAAFSRQTNIKCNIILGSSGKLTAQIIEGAPYDIFISANMNYPQEIFRRGLAIDSPNVYAFGRLVLWSLLDDYKPSLNDLASPAVEHIAIANPDLAPYGIAARETLSYYDYYEKIFDKLVFGESIAQTNQFIVSRSADMGFTAMSVVESPQMKGTGRWVEIDSKSYNPIAQGIVLIRQKDRVKKEAEEFYNFLLSPAAQKILSNFGYHELGAPGIDL